MHGHDGVDRANRSVFVEVVRPERIVLDHLSDHRFRVIATFAERGAGTRLVFRMQFESAAERERVKAFALAVNEQNLDRLQAALESPD